MTVNRGYIHPNIPKSLKGPQICTTFVYHNVSFQSTAPTPDFRMINTILSSKKKKKNHNKEHKEQTTLSIVPFTGYSFGILNPHAIRDGNCPISSNACISLWKVPR